MAGQGYTPFLFSSERELKDTGKWYEMWINPENVGLDKAKIKTTHHTKEAIVIMHWRDELPKLSISGKSGFVRIESELGETTRGLIVGDISGKQVLTNTYNKLKERFSPGIAVKGRRLFDTLDDINREFRPQGDAIDNSPRIFLRNIRRILFEEDDFYYTDANNKIISSANEAADGEEKYNIRYIQMFTKQYPDGITLGGHCTTFNISETAEDSALIPYDIGFTVEKNDNPAGTSRGIFTNLVRNLIRV